MLMIRLQRVGRRNHAEFRVVVTEKARAAKSSNYKELVGHYNPHTNTATFDKERVQHWMSVGAQPSDTVHNLLVSEGIIKGKKINVLPKKSPVVKEEKVEGGSEEELKETEKNEESAEDDKVTEDKEESATLTEKEADKPALEEKETKVEEKKEEEKEEK